MKVQHILAPLLFGAHCYGTESFNSTLSSNSQSTFSFFPPNKARDVNPDMHLVLTFSRPPRVGRSGTIRVYDAKTNEVVDKIDMQIPTSPNPSGRAPGSGSGATKAPGPANPNDKRAYQVNMVGGMDFHFFPIIVRGNIATISLHNNALKTGRTYTIRMDPGVLLPSVGSSKGLVQTLPIPGNSRPKSHCRPTAHRGLSWRRMALGTSIPSRALLILSPQICQDG
jgi:hypothetical protein